MFEVNRLCRTCLTTDKELLSVFALIEEDSNSRIIDYFNECLNYKIIEGDNLPQMICLSCLDNILEVRKFYVQCVDAEHYLKEQMSETDQIKNEEFITIVRKASPTAIKEEYSEIEALNDDDIDNDEIAVNDVIEFEMLDATTSTNVGIVATPTATTSAVATTEIYEENLYECSKCTEGFKYEKNYKLHMKMEHGFSRDEIEVTLQNLNSTLESQENENDGEDAGEDEEQHKDISKKSSKKFQCQLCDYSFRFRANFATHMKRHRLKKEIGCKCPHLGCTREFYDPDTLNQHITKVHFNHDESLLCPKCGIQSTSRKGLQSHLERHQENEGPRRFQCRFCEKAFFNREHLNCHERKHTNERPYVCAVCGKGFKQSSTLKTHMTLHTGKRIACPICDKKFSRKGFLKIHMRTHTDERPYGCDLCPRRYTQKCHLQSHMAGHSNERPHVCHVCGSRFAKKEILRNHRFKHIPKPFKCPSCPLETASSFWFRKHLKRAHNIDDDISKFRRDTNSTATNIEINKETEIYEIKNEELYGGDDDIDEEIIINTVDDNVKDENVL